MSQIEEVKKEYILEVEVLREMQEVLEMKDELSKLKDITSVYEQYVGLVTKNNEILLGKLKAFINKEEVVTKEIVEAMTNEEIFELVQMGQLEGPYDNEDEFIKFAKDFINYLIDQRDSINAIEKDYNKISSEIDEHVERLKEMLGDRKMENLMIDNLSKQVQIFESDLTDENKLKVKALNNKINILKDTFTLEAVYKIYKFMDLTNTIEEYNNKLRRETVISKYNNALKYMNIKSSLITFNNFEKTFLEEKYHNRNNLLIMVLMKYIGCEPEDRSRVGLFIVQIGMILQSLYSDTISEENKELFLNSARRVLDLFEI